MATASDPWASAVRDQETREQQTAIEKQTGLRGMGLSAVNAAKESAQATGWRGANPNQGFKFGAAGGDGKSPFGCGPSSAAGQSSTQQSAAGPTGNLTASFGSLGLGRGLRSGASAATASGFNQQVKPMGAFSSGSGGGTPTQVDQSTQGFGQQPKQSGGSGFGGYGRGTSSTFGGGVSSGQVENGTSKGFGVRSAFGGFPKSGGGDADNLSNVAPSPPSTVREPVKQESGGAFNLDAQPFQPQPGSGTAGGAFNLDAQPFQPQPQPQPGSGTVAPATSPVSENAPVDLSLSTDEDVKPAPWEDISLLNKLLQARVQDVQRLNEGNLEIKQRDHASPLFSVKSFEDLRLKPTLIKALYEMGFYQPSKIQENALPVLLVEPTRNTLGWVHAAGTRHFGPTNRDPQNMIAQSQSGTGKTAAFVLTMLSRVNPDNNWPQCLCLAPTYELALQIGQVVQKMGQFMPEVKMRYAVRGENVARGASITEHIVIGTPGKTVDWLVKYRCIDASKIICLVLDEADVMIARQGHQEQCMRIKNSVEAANPNCQILLFSATYDDEVVAFAEKIVPNPTMITLRLEELSLNNIRQFYVDCRDREQKYKAVVNLYNTLTIAKAIIFCYTRREAAWLMKMLTDRGHQVALLSGELNIEDRARVIQEFKDGHHKVLITTNVCARGIDVKEVTIVINYDPPVTLDKQPDFETYLHRIGRTGRFGKAGIAINFCSSAADHDKIRQIQKHFKMEIRKLDTSDAEQLEAIADEDKLS